MSAAEMTPADVLEGAADVLLIRGRCRTQAVDRDGGLCVLAAMSSVVDDLGFVVIDSPAWHALTAHVGASPVFWNETTTDDFEVIDTLKLVAKNLRGLAVAS